MNHAPQNCLKNAAKGIVLSMGLIALCLSFYLIFHQDTVAVSSVFGSRILPIYCVETDKPEIALTFDAAWGNEDTELILEILEKYDIRATFFMTGGWVESYPEDVIRIYEAGHELGNHSLSHPDMITLSPDEMRSEILTVHTMVQELTGYNMQVFRPPYGSYNNDVIQTLTECGYYGIQWDVDSLDWKNYGVESIIRTVCEHENLGNGSIILCHNGAEYTAAALEEMICNLLEQGYSFVTVSDLILKENYHIDVTGRQIANP